MDFFDLHSLLPTILLAICTYFLRNIHKDFQDMKAEIVSQKLQWAMLETKVSAVVERLNRLEDKTDNGK